MSGPFILRPVATTLLTIAVVMLGLLGYRLLPIAALPDVDFPTIQVVTAFPGASPDVVETSVTAPLAGTVTSVRVAEGDVVEPGDLLLTIEAIKMEHRVTATAAGKVVRVAVAERDVVREGDVLVEIE